MEPEYDIRDPYTGICEDKMTMPSDLCFIEDTKKDFTLARYKLEYGPDSEPEHIKIDFNNAP